MMYGISAECAVVCFRDSTNENKEGCYECDNPHAHSNDLRKVFLDFHLEVSLLFLIVRTGRKSLAAERAVSPAMADILIDAGDKTVLPSSLMIWFRHFSMSFRRLPRILTNG